MNSGGCVTQDKCIYAGGPGCFVSGTLVETPHGAIAIEHLVVGDRVLGLSDDGMSVVNEVVEVHRALAVQYYIINDEISVTGAHPFLVGDEWVEAQDIRVGDTL
ncbi:MAG: Hint domain-containing protein, partial [Planctomycetota bacterium]